MSNRIIHVAAIDSSNATEIARELTRYKDPTLVIEGRVGKYRVINNSFASSDGAVRTFSVVNERSVRRDGKRAKEISEVLEIDLLARTAKISNGHRRLAHPILPVIMELIRILI